ncbi:hypothetical protein ACLOJK_014871, partial [Asimina triloba]
AAMADPSSLAHEISSSPSKSSRPLIAIKAAERPATNVLPKSPKPSGSIIQHPKAMAVEDM